MAKWAISVVSLLLILSVGKSETENGLENAQLQPVLTETGTASGSKLGKLSSDIAPQPLTSENGKKPFLSPENNSNNGETPTVRNDPSAVNKDDASSLSSQHLLENNPLGNADLGFVASDGKTEAAATNVLQQKLGESAFRKFIGMPPHSTTLKSFHQEGETEVPGVDSNSVPKALLALGRKIPSDLSPEQREQWRQNISDAFGLSPLDPGKAMLPLGSRDQEQAMAQLGNSDQGQAMAQLGNSDLGQAMAQLGNSDQGQAVVPSGNNEQGQAMVPSGNSDLGQAVAPSGNDDQGQAMAQLGNSDLGQAMVPLGSSNQGQVMVPLGSEPGQAVLPLGNSDQGQAMAPLGNNDQEQVLLPLGSVKSGYTKDKVKLSSAPSGSQNENAQEAHQPSVQQNGQPVQDAYQPPQEVHEQNYQPSDSQDSQNAPKDTNAPAVQQNDQDVAAGLLPKFIGSSPTQDTSVTTDGRESTADARYHDDYFYEKDYEDDEAEMEDENYDYEGDGDLPKEGRYGDDYDQNIGENVEVDNNDPDEEAYADHTKSVNADGTDDVRDQAGDDKDLWNNNVDDPYQDEEEEAIPPSWRPADVNSAAQDTGDLAKEKTGGMGVVDNSEPESPYDAEEDGDDDYKFDDTLPWMDGKPADSFEDDDDDEWYYNPDAAREKGTSEKADNIPVLSSTETSTKSTTEPYDMSEEEEEEATKSQISSPEFKEGVISVEEARSRKPLQAPKGTIVLYTVLIVFFIAGIVVFSIWKNPFKSAIRPSHSTPVRTGEEGKRLLDHPFV